MKKILLGVVAGLMVASCSKNETVSLNQDEIQFSVVTNKAPRVKTVEVSNSFARMSEEEANRYIAEGVYTEEDSRIFVSSAGDIYCNGDICTTEYEKTAERPSAVMSKYRNINLKWSVLAAFCIGYKTIAEFTNSDIDSIEASIGVGRHPA